MNDRLPRPAEHAHRTESAGASISRVASDGETCTPHCEPGTILCVPGTFYNGDNLDVLREWIPDACVDLVYLDPPFNSQQDFNLPFGAEAARPEQVDRAFRDRWWWDDDAIRAYEELTKLRVELLPEKLPGLIRSLHQFLYPKHRHAILAYVVNMAIRLVELHRVMKSTASLYLHCDPTASHYLKLVLDSIFGPENFVNEITWQRTNARSFGAVWPRVHDALLFYRKSPEAYFAPTVVSADSKKMPHTLITGPDGKKYQTFELTGQGTRNGETGRPWRGFNPTEFGRHWANLHGFMNELDKRGLIHWPKKGSQGGFPRRRAEEPFDVGSRTVTVGDVWTDIDRLNQTAKERTGYPTQKPLGLLKRVVEASSRPGDLVLDPFCGCGTTIIACEQLDRRWIGIDIGEEAINVLRDTRIPKEAPSASFKEEIEPFDEESARRLAAKSEYEFQWWAVRRLGGQQVGGKKKKGPDRGIDGEIQIEEYDDDRRRRRVIVSVKTGGSPSVAWVNELHSAVANPVHKAHMGILVTLEPPKSGMRERAREYGTVRASLADHLDPYKIQIVTAADLFTKGHGVDLPGKNVTPKTQPQLQTTLPFDQGPVKNKARIADGLPPKGQPKKGSAHPEEDASAPEAPAPAAEKRRKKIR